MEIFFTINKKADGALTRAELFQAYEDFKFSEVTMFQIDMIFAFVDRDCSGLISFQEFMMCAVVPAKFLTTKKLAAVFDAFDDDKGGSVSVAEIRKLIQPTRTIDDFGMRTLLGLEPTEDLNIEVTCPDFSSMILRAFESDGH